MYLAQNKLLIGTGYQNKEEKNENTTLNVHN